MYFKGVFERVAWWEGVNNKEGRTIGVAHGHSGDALRGREAPVFYPGCANQCPNGVQGPRVEPIAVVNDDLTKRRIF